MMFKKELLIGNLICTWKFFEMKVDIFKYLHMNKKFMARVK